MTLFEQQLMTVAVKILQEMQEISTTLDHIQKSLEIADEALSRYPTKEEREEGKDRIIHYTKERTLGEMIDRIEFNTTRGDNPY
jgi:hypothetical protein